MVRWLLPREQHFYDYLERQALAAHEGATALATFNVEGTSLASVAAAVQVVEHKGDAIVHELEEALAKTFVTPIDREDLQELSSQLDDVLDLTNGAARGCVLFGVTRPTPAMTALTAKLVECTGGTRYPTCAITNTPLAAVTCGSSIRSAWAVRRR